MRRNDRLMILRLAYAAATLAAAVPYFVHRMVIRRRGRVVVWDDCSQENWPPVEWGVEQ